MNISGKFKGEIERYLEKLHKMSLTGPTGATGTTGPTGRIGPIGISITGPAGPTDCDTEGMVAVGRPQGGLGGHRRDPFWRAGIA